MGGIAKAAVGGLSPMTAALSQGDKAGSALGGLGKALGLSGDQGDYFHANNQNPALGMMNTRNGAANSDEASRAVENYGTKGDSLADALQTGHDGGFDGNQMAALTGRLASDPLSGSRLATEQVQGNSILGGLYGKGGQLDKSMALGDKLQNQGYALTPEDHEAYGQASGDIARMFGQSEQSLGQSLADRGLAGGSNGAAGVGFSGLQGNKNEMLAKAQTDIADKRMQNTMQRIGQNNQLMTSLGNGANTAINDQYSRNQSGLASQNGLLSDASKQTIAQNAGANSSDLASQEDQRGAKGKTLLEGLGNGLFSSASGIGAAPGKAAGAAADGSMAKNAAAAGAM